MSARETVLVTGATGYVGGRLIPRLLSEGYTVRALARDAARIQDRTWFKDVEVIEGDVLDPSTLETAFDGVQAAYYLIHSMMAGSEYHQRDLKAARQFGSFAQGAKLQRIIYLGGLGDPNADLSRHLRSRQQTGEALREAGVPVFEFRAGVIVGAGSISFEMIRYLTERIPLMICPRWVFTRTQPIHISNVLDYLIASLRHPGNKNPIVEIGGPEIMSYGDMLQGYANVRGLKRWILPVPVLTPRLSSYWVHWVTPIPAAVARPLIEGLRDEVLVRADTAGHLFPEIELIDYQTAVRKALEHLEVSEMETSLSDVFAIRQGDVVPVKLTTREGMIIERRMLEVEAPTDSVYKAFTGLGGERGWLYANWLWRVRGAIDRLFGGVGLRRYRRDPDHLRVGDVLDFYRVEHVEPDRMMRLLAEMRLPGRAWLQFEVHPLEGDRSLLVQTAMFAPKGLLGLLYWHLLYPIHARVFSSLISELGNEAVKMKDEAASR
ncbi:MAG: DUF2867 domain-containing protein [Candidatus Hodarchaeota archaeon]